MKEVNDAGGLALPDGSQLPIEVVQYDDRSSAEEAVRAIERLANQDEVDFTLPPWGTGFNLAVAPRFDRFGYPQLAVSAVTDKAPELVKRWKKSFWLLAGGHDYTDAPGGLLAKAVAEGKINGEVAMISVPARSACQRLRPGRAASRHRGGDRGPVAPRGAVPAQRSRRRQWYPPLGPLSCERRQRLRHRCYPDGRARPRALTIRVAAVG